MRRPFRAADRKREEASLLHDELDCAERRHALVRTLAKDGIENPAVLTAIAAIPRHKFVPPSLQSEAHDNVPLPIGEGQTISQPYIVALMTAQAQVTPNSRVLEIGTGSGYQTAVLARLCKEVFTIELSERLSLSARAVLASLAVSNVHFRVGDGYAGWPDAAPFDAIVVTAAPPRVPPPLLEQLATNGRLVIPVGNEDQRLRVIARVPAGFVESCGAAVRFVPMTGRVQTPDQ